MKFLNQQMKISSAIVTKLITFRSIWRKWKNELNMSQLEKCKLLSLTLETSIYA
jgi:hypothetical protein